MVRRAQIIFPEMANTNPPPLTVERLRWALDYDPYSGEFRWTGVLKGRGYTFAKTGAGVLAGAPDGNGYRLIGVDGKLYRAHRLAWLYMTGQWPTRHVDHEDRDTSNDRWGNLRLASASQNGGNSTTKKNNKSGFKGVHRRPRDGRWVAQISCRRQNYWLGAFDTPEEAHAAYVAEAQKYFGEFARAA